uniref:Uncharacterized protein n=1 Tax=Rhizophora mucronata TaxID=61149 RepID=A0A2P2QMT8_RHIMU
MKTILLNTKVETWTLPKLCVLFDPVAELSHKSNNRTWKLTRFLLENFPNF